MSPLDCLNFSEYLTQQAQGPHMTEVYTSQTALCVAIATFTVAANLVVITALIHAKRRGSNPSDSRNNNNSCLTKLLMTSLAFSDLMLGATIMPLESVKLLNRGKLKFGSVLCAFRVNMNNVLCAVSVLHIFSMAIDRLVAVCRPLLYRQLSETTGYVMISLSWGVPLVFIFIPDLVVWDFNTDSQQCFIYNIHCGAPYRKPFQTAFSIVVFFVSFGATYVMYFIVLWRVQQFHKRKEGLGKNSKEKSNERTYIDKNLNPGGGYFIGMVGRAIRGLCGLCGAVDGGSGGHFQDRSRVENDIDSGRRAQVTNNVKKQEVALTPQCGLDQVQHASSVNCENDTASALTCSWQTFNSESTHGADATHRINPHTPHSDPTPTINLRSKDPVFTKRNFRAFRTIGYVLLCFTISWSPSVCTASILSSSDILIPNWVFWTISLMAYISSALNPVLYCSNRSIRRAVMSLVTCRRSPS